MPALTHASNPAAESDGREDPASVVEDENELQLMADALPVLIARVDARERYLFNNRAYEAWFGLPPAALQGRTIREVIGEDAYGRFAPHLRAAFAGRKESFESHLRHRKLGERAVQVHYVPRFNGGREVEGLYVLAMDVTEHRRAEGEVQRLNSELERRVAARTAQLESTNKELEAFCYSVSHDLRAPLRSIRGFGEVLLEQYARQLDERGRDFLRRACQASAQMDGLIEDLLKLSRVARGEVRAGPVDLSALARDITSELRQAEPSRAVEVVIAPDLTARGDERLLRVALDNLLRNAWKFTSKQPRAQIEFGRSASDPETFFVRDNGAGFDMAYAGKLFGVFQRLHSVSEFPGSGVGLAIVQRIISRHGGHTWALGRVNAGATFYFTLPSGAGA